MSQNPPSSYALIATVTFNGTAVEHIRVPRGRSVVIGRDDALAVPIPAGAPYLAECTWDGPDAVKVRDGRGREHRVGPEDETRVTVGPVELSLSLAPQFTLKRTRRMDTIASLAWLAIVLMATITSEGFMLAYNNQCEWTPLRALVTTLQPGWCSPPVADNGGIDITAEYLARLLKEDYAGDDEGAIVQELDRPDSEKRSERAYIPAGNDGPIDEMGGAAETSPDPVRTPEEDVAPPIPEEGADSDPLVLDENGTPIDAGLDEPDEDDGEAGLVEEPDEEDEIDALEPPSEEEQGWGIRDWYDEQDERIDNLEIELMLEVAKKRLKIDPNDPEALSILSYYQYLAQDYDAALDTYDRYIARYPDSAAGYNNKALVYKRQGDYEIEERMYRVALALEPGDVTAMNNLAVNLAHQGRHEEALALMEELEVLDPGDAYADLHRAKIYAEMGRDREALHYLDLSLQGMQRLDTLHHIEFRQDIRVDPSFAKLRETRAFRDVLVKYYGEDSPLQEG